MTKIPSRTHQEQAESRNGRAAKGKPAAKRPKERDVRNAEATGAGEKAGFLDLSNQTAAESLSRALEPDSLLVLAGMCLDDPGGLEGYYRRLKDAGATARDLQGLKAAVKGQSRQIKEHRKGEARRKVRAARGALAGEGPGLKNYLVQEVETTEGVAAVRVGLPVQEIACQLLQLSGGWPRRMGNLLFAEAPGPEPRWLPETCQLFGWMASLLPAQGSNRLRWADGEDKITQRVFHAHLTQAAENFLAVEPFPHHPPIERHYYMHPPVRGGDGQALDELLRCFCPATAVDCDLIEAYFLTAFWGGEAGSRPAWLFTGAENDLKGGRGVGKSTVAKMLGVLLGKSITLDQTAEIGDLKTRLLSPEALSARLVLIDNVKTLRFSWGELEAQITGSAISGHQMYVGEGQRPNTLLWTVTLNGASLSRDMAQRCVIVQLARPRYTATWEEETKAFIERNRWRIVGDVIARLQSPANKLPTHSRWGAWEDGVLARVAGPSACQEAILQRQGAVDEDSAEADLIREAFAAEVQKLGCDPEVAVVFLPTRRVSEIVAEATGENRPANKATTYLNQLGIAEIRAGVKSNGRRGCVWTGRQARPSACARHLPDNDPFPD